jgi:hypothetical protein
MSADNKKKVRQNLARTIDKGTDAYWALRIAGEEAEAEKVRKKTNQLRREMDKLLAAAVDDWTGRADLIIEDTRKRNGKLQDAIRDIENKVKIGERVVKVLGYLDDALEVAANLTKKIATA